MEAQLGATHVLILHYSILDISPFSSHLSCRSRWEMRNYQRVDLLLVLAKDDKVRELLVGCKGTDLLDGESASFVIKHPRENTDELCHELEQLL